VDKVDETALVYFVHLIRTSPEFVRSVAHGGRSCALVDGGSGQA
jgi:hypothetical protein